MRQLIQQKNGTALYYGEATGKTGLDAGVYDMTTVAVAGQYIPAYDLITTDNDPPLDVNKMIGGLSAEIGEFFKIKEKYDRFGFAHKRGYILWGPAGCGKSSALRLLQQNFINQYQGIVLSWTGNGSVSEYYENIRANEPDRPILIVCEDVDSKIRSFETEILEFLDGQKGLKNFVLVATTNYLEAIPERIKNRPSRIDRLIEVGFPTRKAQGKYLAKLGLTEEEIAPILDAVGTTKLSMAALKEIVIGTYCLGYKPSDVIKRLNNPEINASFSLAEDDDDDSMDSYNTNTKSIFGRRS